MKKFLSLICFLFCLTSHAQDTIVTHSGDKIPAIVKSISSKEVEYKKAGNPDGPSYITAKNDVKAIHYSNGTKDEFGPPVAKTNDDYYSAGGSATIAPASNMNMSQVKMASEIVFYGLDFSNFSLIEQKRTDEGQKIRDIHFPEWNTYFVKEIPEKTMARWLRKKNVTFDNSVVSKLNAQADPNKVAVASLNMGNMYESIKRSIAAYTTYDSRQQGIGFVINVEYFDRRKLETSAYFTFFDIATHSIISTERVSVRKAQGGGLTNFWGVGLFEVMKDYIDKKYKFL